MTHTLSREAVGWAVGFFKKLRNFISNDQPTSDDVEEASTGSGDRVYPVTTRIVYRRSSPGSQGTAIVQWYGNQDLAAPRPVVFDITGGGWRKGSPEADANLPTYYKGKGFVYVNVGYRLSPNNSDPMSAWESTRFKYDHVLDVAQGIAAVRNRFAEFNFDPARMVLSGHSAGAHLAGLLCSKTSLLDEAGVNSSAVMGGILYDTAFYDLVNRYRAVTTLIANAFGILPEFSPGPAAYLDYNNQSDGVLKMNQYSPALHITPGRSRPQCIIQAGPASEIELGLNYLRALENAGVPDCFFQGYTGSYDHNQTRQACGGQDPPAGVRLYGEPTITSVCDRALNTWLNRS